MINNKKESRIIKLIFAVAAIMTFIVTVLNSILSNYEQLFGSKENLVYVQIGALIVSLTILWFGREYLTSVIIKAPFFKEKTSYPIDGNWTLKIVYNDGNKIVKRFGDISLHATTYGLQVVGGAVMDLETDEVKVANWLSEYAEIIADTSGVKLIYSYKTFRQDTNAAFSKIGTVVATKSSNSDCFNGRFTDILLGQNGDEVSEETRHGEVQIMHNAAL